jgi:hypothetical protein
MGYTTFLDDEAGYQAWRAANPNGYIVNHDRRPSDRYLVLHRVDCGSLSGEPARGDTWTIAFGKTCVPTIEELESWARTIAHGTLRRCGMCRPQRHG